MHINLIILISIELHILVRETSTLSENLQFLKSKISMQNQHTISISNEENSLNLSNEIEYVSSLIATNNIAILQKRQAIEQYIECIKDDTLYLISRLILINNLELNEVSIHLGISCEDVKNTFDNYFFTPI